jgi:hypothetical protein
MFKYSTPLSSKPTLALQQGFKGYGSLSRQPPKPSPKSHPSYDPKRRARRSKNEKYHKNGRKKVRNTGVYASTSIKETLIVYPMHVSDRTIWVHNMYAGINTKLHRMHDRDYLDVTIDWIRY